MAALVNGKQYEAEKMTQGGDRKSKEFSNEQNVHLKSRWTTKNEVDKMSGSFSKRETRDGTAGRIGKEYGVDGRTIRRDAEYAKGVDAIEKDSPWPARPDGAGQDVSDWQAVRGAEDDSGQNCGDGARWRWQIHHK